MLPNLALNFLLLKTAGSSGKAKEKGHLLENVCSVLHELASKEGRKSLEMISKVQGKALQDTTSSQLPVKTTLAVSSSLNF